MAKTKQTKRKTSQIYPGTIYVTGDFGDENYLIHKTVEAAFAEKDSGDDSITIAVYKLQGVHEASHEIVLK